MTTFGVAVDRFRLTSAEVSCPGLEWGRTPMNSRRNSSIRIFTSIRIQGNAAPRQALWLMIEESPRRAKSTRLHSTRPTGSPSQGQPIRSPRYASASPRESYVNSAEAPEPARPRFRVTKNIFRARLSPAPK